MAKDDNSQQRQAEDYLRDMDEERREIEARVAELEIMHINNNQVNAMGQCIYMIERNVIDEVIKQHNRLLRRTRRAMRNIRRGIGIFIRRLIQQVGRRPELLNQ